MAYRTKIDAAGKPEPTPPAGWHVVHIGNNMMAKCPWGNWHAINYWHDADESQHFIKPVTLAMLIAVGFGVNPITGSNWSPETLRRAYDDLPAFRKAAVLAPDAWNAAQHARMRRCIRSGMKHFEDYHRLVGDEYALRGAAVPASLRVAYQAANEFLHDAYNDSFGDRSATLVARVEAAE